MPLPVISVQQMREWERATWAAGRTEGEVIERVGKALAGHALKMTQPGDCILILAGRGHNGDDARRAEPHLKNRAVVLLNVANPEDALREFREVTATGDEQRPRPALIVDGLFGIGLNRPLDPQWQSFINEVNHAAIPILSVDVPSGLDANRGEPQGAAIRAAATLTVGAPKRGMLSAGAIDCVGRLDVARDVGLLPCPHTSDLHWILPEDFSGWPPPRPVAGHKGSFGHAAIVAGSVGYHGAAVMAARGALRARPGLVTLFTLESVYLPVASQLQQVMVHPWRPARRLPDTCTALLFGPGLAAEKLPVELKNEFRALWKESSLPLIADASALDWLLPGAVGRDAVRVITPHPGEAARLLRSSNKDVLANRFAAVRDLSRRFGNCHVVLKGHQTLIGRSEGGIFVNSSGNPSLGQGGTGDVLAGYLAGLLAQPALQNAADETLRYGVWSHGAAADHLSESRTNWTVDELIAVLGRKLGTFNARRPGEVE